MIWSKYNYLYYSKKHESFFLYNSRTNSFLSLSYELYTFLNKLKNSSNIEDEILKIDEDIRNSLLTSKVFISQFEEQNIITQKKLVKYNGSLQQDVLGIVLLPTFACNFKCPYCYEAGLPYDFMSEQTENKLIDFIKANKSCANTQLCWHGGEPLVAFNNIKSILQKISKEKEIKIIKHSMVSNGYLLNKEKCMFLNEYSLNTIQITIDGLKENHNKSRIHKNGNPTYDIILDNVENVFKYIPKCNVTIRMNVHSENEMDYPVLREELKKRWGNQKYFLDMRYVIAEDDTINNSGCRIKCFKNRDKIHFLKKMYEDHNCSEVSFYPSPQLGGCTATYMNSFVIAPTGELYKCWADVGKKDRVIGDIFKGNSNATLLSEFIMGTDMFTDEKCLNCLLFPICDGGCNLTRLEYKLTGKKYDVCPIDTNDLDLLFDMFYEQRRNLSKVTNIN